MIWPFVRKEQEPLAILAEQLEVAIKAGRRCAYDLNHAADNVSDPELREVFRQRCDTWLAIFMPADGVKDYTNRLHRQIERLQRDVRLVKEEAKKHGVDIECIDFWADHDD